MSLDYNQGGVAVPMPNVYVSTKVEWNADWTEEPHLIPLTLETGANQQSVGRFLYQSGTILREGATETVDVTSLDITGHLVMIEVYVREADGSDGDLLDRWIGTFEDDTRDVIGVPETGPAAVNQTLVAYGMERLLDARTVRGSWIMGKNPFGSDTIACYVATPMLFNAPGWGTSTGQKNRHFEGATHHFVQYVGGGQAVVWNAWGERREEKPCAFGLLEDDARGSNKDKSWNLGEVLGYLISFFGPIIDHLYAENAYGFRLNTLEHVKDLEPSPAAEKLLSALFGEGANPALVEVYGFTPEGKTLFECLNELCTPRRGLGWRLFYDDDCAEHTKGPTIVLFSVNETAITVGTATLPATPLQATLELTGRQDIHYFLGKTAVHNYGAIIVQGERILSCFSISGADGSLEKGWTSQEETQYTLPTGLTLPADFDKMIEYRARSRVWKEFVVKKDWNFKAKNGENGGSGMVVNPLMNDDAAIIETPSSLTRRDKRFEDFIPVTIVLPEGATVPPEPLLMPPRAFAKFKGLGGDVWIDLVNNRRPEAPEAMFRMLDDRMGVEVICRPADRLGAGTYDTTQGFQTINWSTEMILTVAMRTDRRVSYTITTEGDFARQLVIDVPDAELWLIAEGTVYDVDKNGALLRTVAADRVCRDDRDRLKQVAAMAQAWYGAFRRSMRLTFKSLTYRLPDSEEEEEYQGLYIGLLVSDIHDTVTTAAINTVIWSRSIDFIGNRIVYETASPSPPDFGAAKEGRLSRHSGRHRTSARR